MSFDVRLVVAQHYNLRSGKLKLAPFYTGPYTSVRAPIMQYQIPGNVRLWLQISKTGDSRAILSGSITVTRVNHPNIQKTEHMHYCSSIRVGLPKQTSYMHYRGLGAQITGDNLNKIQISLDTMCKYPEEEECENMFSLHVSGLLNNEAVDEVIFGKITENNNTFINRYALHAPYSAYGDPAIYMHRSIRGICPCRTCGRHLFATTPLSSRQSFLRTLAAS